MQLTVKVDDRRLKILDEIKALNSDHLFLWGSGSYSRNIKHFLQVEGGYKGTILTIVDDSYCCSDSENVIPLSEFIKMNNYKVPIVFAFYNYKMVQQKKEKWSTEFPYLFDFHFTIVNGKRLLWDPSFIKTQETAYCRTYKLLSDAHSKKVMQLYLNAATAGEFHELFSKCYEEPAYFNRITKELIIDTLIDCGAYDGDSIHDFVSVFPRYKKIIAFEPDPVNLKKLNCRKVRENIRDLIVVNKGVGSRNEHLHFQINGGSNSYLAESGNSEIEMTTLDDVYSDTSGTVLIKMDIEGAELNALQGAKKLIKEKKPVLAICVYHKEEDLIEIPGFIHEIAGEGVYNYYLGFHGLDLAELVFYAVPKNLNRCCAANC